MTYLGVPKYVVTKSSIAQVQKATTQKNSLVVDDFVGIDAQLGRAISPETLAVGLDIIIQQMQTKELLMFYNHRECNRCSLHIIVTILVICTCGSKNTFIFTAPSIMRNTAIAVQ